MNLPADLANPAFLAFVRALEAKIAELEARIAALEPAE
jgi:hypothetical protein